MPGRGLKAAVGCEQLFGCDQAFQVSAAGRLVCDLGAGDQHGHEQQLDERQPAEQICDWDIAPKPSPVP